MLLQRQKVRPWVPSLFRFRCRHMYSLPKDRNFFSLSNICSSYNNIYPKLRYYQNKGHDKIMSNELARELGINSTSVRRDISYLGHMGRQGYGYDIKKLIDELKKELGDGKDEGIVLMGVGNMGKALLKYNTFSFQVGTIVC